MAYFNKDALFLRLIRRCWNGFDNNCDIIIEGEENTFGKFIFRYRKNPSRTTSWRVYIKDKEKMIKVGQEVLRDYDKMFAKYEHEFYNYGAEY